MHDKGAHFLSIDEGLSDRLDREAARRDRFTGDAGLPHHDLRFADGLFGVILVSALVAAIFALAVH